MSTTLPSTRESLIKEAQYSQKARGLIALVNDLRSLGADQLKLDLPCLAFIGNQSAGKSSVVEGATGIAVPRDSGTCTKCPMQCTMMRADGAWSCEIRLQFLYDEHGEVMTSPRIVPFQTVADPKSVEIWLKRAQVAILSPDTDASIFHDKSSEELKALQTLPFSKNTIEILVRDPEGTDLCFVDLPGIIQHHIKDDAMVPYVKKLVEAHIKRENTIIVVTIPMTDDIENQEAFSIASRVDTDGQRTIGVGTKPDMLGPGSISALESWKKILAGTTSNLKHGYYCVKMPDDRERQNGLTRAQWSAKEASFFEKTEPWKDVDDRSRFGMRNFVESTSKLLISLIETNLPVIKRTVDELLSKETEKLRRLPQPLADGAPMSMILLRAVKFCRSLQEIVHGSSNKAFVQRNQARYERFKTDIALTAPNFQTRAEYGYISASSTRPSSTSSTRVSSSPKVITFGDVKAAIASHHTWELPGYTPYEATKALILQHVRCWQEPLIDCFNDISQSTFALINQLIHDSEHFGRFSELQAFVRTIVAEERQHFQVETSTMLNKLFELENSGPIFTADHAVFDQARREWLNAEHLNGSSSEEYKVMADVHAYFQVASSRFIDVVVKCIEGEWHKKLVARLEHTLIGRIPVIPGERLESMLQEDPSIRLKRENLSQKITQLTKIKARLLEYENEVA
ncbi:P-loop containing nucleoside triphosphate hydrolase protein [Ephemerocybe angulata]|uniref:P-loop containing nucleoside triphosphate hydrolase protein n=1 Tax=Ephemerocybe angulata TaxID=980116 RepID=A0A8H6LUH9_9AGAR|nr:P-loop containing nucleoside triphosphate hydrolase protein [Tulosesus angulatus]